MSELTIFPEMLQAGMEAIAECREQKLDDQDTAVSVYLAMQGIYEIRMMRGNDEVLH